MSSYNFSKAVNIEKLEDEINASIISTRYDGLTTMGGQLTILTTMALDEAEYSVLEAIVTNHTNTPSIKQIVRQKRQEAQDFGLSIYNTFIEENIALGITQRGLTSHVRKTLSEVSDAVLSGSLYDAIEEIIVLDQATLDPIVMSAPRLLGFRNKIEDFLQIPKATVWNQSKTW
jgi:hypothetical protein